MRSLASIEKIATVSPIPEADAIEVITMEGKGWKCVVKKGSLKPGDKCVYVEIDSFLPNAPQFSFLSKNNILKKMIIEDGKEVEGHRIKSIKLKNTLSQGLVFPLDILLNYGEIIYENGNSKKLIVKA